MLKVNEIATSAEERVLSGVKIGQALVIDGIKNTVALADRVIPENLSGRIDRQVSGLPMAAPVLNGYFDFAGKMLAAQRDFAGEIVEIFQPAPVDVAPAKRAPATKTAAPKVTKSSKATAKTAKASK